MSEGATPFSDENGAGVGPTPPPPDDARNVVVTLTLMPDAHGNHLGINFPEGMYVDDVLAIVHRAERYLERCALIQEINTQTQRAMKQRDLIVKTIGRNPKGLLG